MPTRWDSDVETIFDWFMNTAWWLQSWRLCWNRIQECPDLFESTEGGGGGGGGGGGTAAWAFDIVSRFHYNSKLVLQQFLVYQDWSYSSIELLKTSGRQVSILDHLIFNMETMAVDLN